MRYLSRIESYPSACLIIDAACDPWEKCCAVFRAKLEAFLYCISSNFTPGSSAGAYIEEETT